ncbi:chromosome partitioning protein ParA [Rhodoplanes elegans]|uniref:Chromosome partitioning protein ParA n=1 Tax=Rhodoplanes elegans TaxID=29408 RepID=A0A327KK55_9BRAD|nr:AAA family ATPase [Rhodoplanes elegans]MBK5956679.1 chromosome partitioning protein ParA [Rhodoplanes elegans]RAI39190.1 chromosome partitioning protein ParA [Rhodoplanes elegans]
MKTIALVTQKGGSGKSTLAIGLAVAAQQDGETVFILETDKQGTVANWALRRTDPDPAVDRVSGGAELDRALALLASKGYTLAVIDTPGVDSVTVTAAIRAADLCLIPARPSPADIEAANPTLDAIRKLGKEFAFVLNQAPVRSYRINEASSALNMWGVLALPHIVQRNDHQDALGAGQGVTEFSPDSKAAEEIRALWAWVKKRMRGSENELRAIA